MASAGQRLVAGRIPGERIATNVRTSASSSVSSETEIDTVTAPLVSGRTYQIRWTAALGTSVNGNTAFIRIREDNVSGAQLQIERPYLPSTGGSGTRYPATLEVEYTAVSTGNKTFSGTLALASGSGTVNVQGNATYPVYMYVNYLYG